MGRLALALVLTLVVALAPVPQPHARAASDGWSGTITEKQEFDWFRTRSLHKQTIQRRDGAPSATWDSWEQSHWVDGERTIAISVNEGQAVATISGKGIYSLDETATQDTPDCLRTLYWTENMDAYPHGAGRPADLSVVVTDSGQYTIDGSGTNPIDVDYTYEWHERRNCVGTAPTWDIYRDSTLPVRPQRLGERDGRYDWTGAWTTTVTGKTCDPDHLKGRSSDPNSGEGLAQTGWRSLSASDAKAIAWYTESRDRTGIIDPYADDPVAGPLIRVTKEWDLQRPSGSGGAGSGATGEDCTWLLDIDNAVLHRTVGPAGNQAVINVKLNAKQLKLAASQGEISGSGPVTLVDETVELYGEGKLLCTWSYGRKVETIEVHGSKQGDDLVLRLTIPPATYSFTPRCSLPVPVPLGGAHNASSAPIWGEVLGEIRLPSAGGTKPVSQHRELLGPQLDDASGKFTVTVNQP